MSPNTTPNTTPTSTTKILSFNCRGLASLEKILNIRKFIDSNKIDIALLQESLVKSLPDEFYSLFPSTHFMSRHTKKGQGLVSIVRLANLPDGLDIQILDKSIGDISLLHVIQFSEGYHTFNVLNIYHGPKSAKFPDKLFDLLSDIDVCGGDMNCYIGRNNLQRYRQFENLLETRFLPLCTSNSYINSASDDIGPDHFLLNTTSLVSSDAATFGTLESDHKSLILEVTVDWWENFVEPPSSVSKSLTIFDYNKISSSFMEESYASIPVKPSLEVFYSLWQSWLSKCTLKITVDEDRPSNSIFDSLSAANSSSEFGEIMADWLCQADNISNVGETFKVLNHFSKIDHDKQLAITDSSKKISRTSELKSFDAFKQNASSAGHLSSAKLLRYKRAVKWYRRIVGRNNSIQFSVFEFKLAISKVSKSCVGPDRIPMKFLPKKDEDIKKLLFAVNESLFSLDTLPQQLKDATASFIPKANDPLKLRSIQMVSRLSAVIETLVSNRLMEILLKTPKFDDRHGFIKNRSTDQVIGKLVDKLWSNDKSGRKSAVVSLDQSRAYDTVNHKFLIVKLKRLVQQHKQYERFAVIVAFTDLWLHGRITSWGNFKVNVRVGVPQGSPYSCLLYVVYFDYSAPLGLVSLSLYYADDVHFFVEGSTWPEVESKIEALEVDFSRWCLSNGQIVNQSKSTCCFIHRKSEPPTNFALADSTVQSFRCLGVTFQSNFNFNLHVLYLQKWIKTRTSIIRILRSKLSLSTDVLLRVAQTYRAKVLYGSFWLLVLSKSQFDTLSCSIMGLFRAVAGFNKMVPTETVLEFLGLDSLSTYFCYWLATRSADAKVTGQFDIFNIYLLEPESNELPISPRHSYNLRQSTVRATSSSKSESKFPLNAEIWFENTVDMRKDALGFFGQYLKGYKVKLKRKYLKRILAKGTEVIEAVDELNKKYYNKVMGQNSEEVI